MEYRKLGRTDLEVSALCLGTMTWGEQNTLAEGHAQMDYAVDQGINFFDTAELYPIPPKASTQGRTEEIIGEWFKARRKRDKIILATKVVGRTKMTWFRKDGSPGQLSKAQIHEAVDGSLKRLQTDYIDLYQLHWPDRPLRLFGGIAYEHIEADTHPIAETVEVLEELKRDGKIRHIGLSNETAWGAAQFLAASDAGKGPRVVSIQNAFSLLNRTFEIELAEFSAREDVGLLAYSPLAQGYLSGKYRDGALPRGSRKALFNRLERYETPAAERAMAGYFEIAEKYRLDPVHMALQFVTTRPFVTSNIIGATTMQQLETNIASTRVQLTQEILDDIEAVHLMHSNPCP